MRLWNEGRYNFIVCAASSSRSCNNIDEKYRNVIKNELKVINVIKIVLVPLKDIYLCILEKNITK